MLRNDLLPHSPMVVVVSKSDGRKSVQILLYNDIDLHPALQLILQHSTRRVLQQLVVLRLMKLVAS